ncbi:MAG: Rho termination factor N-terminal domain-containing protein [Candidatus Lokiarchaeota archaeon]
MTRNIDDRKYLTYLLLSLNVDELKQICRDYSLKGYSKLKKLELIEFILDSLAEEEMRELIKNKEPEIIENGINSALEKIAGEDREHIKAIKIVNPSRNEVEIAFKGFNWETTSFLSITEKNIENPDRDCDCRIGANMGFCGHFWVGFIFSLKNDYFDLKDWTLTYIPKNFKEKIDPVEIKIPSSVEEKEGEKPKEVTLIDKTSGEGILIGFLDSRITVYNGEITKIEERKSEFQGNVTIYYMINLKNVKFGPQLQKKSEYDENQIKEIDGLLIRLSDTKYNKLEPKEGDKVSFNGSVDKDNFWGLMLKRVTKVKRV